MTDIARADLTTGWARIDKARSSVDRTTSVSYFHNRSGRRLDEGLNAAHERPRGAGYDVLVIEAEGPIQTFDTPRPRGVAVVLNSWTSITRWFIAPERASSLRSSAKASFKQGVLQEGHEGLDREKRIFAPCECIRINVFDYADVKTIGLQPPQQELQTIFDIIAGAPPRWT